MAEEPQAIDSDNGAWELPSGKELGNLLRARREELGLGYGDITAQIRVKERHLEAIENEAWDRLPPPTFVKGFIRLYARALGLPEERLAALYEETGPPAQPFGKKVRQRPPKRSALPYLAGVLLLFAAAAALYLWRAPTRLTETPVREEQPAADPVAKQSSPDTRTQSSGLGDTGRRGEGGNPAASAAQKTAESVNPPADSAAHEAAKSGTTPSGGRAEPERSVSNAAHPASKTDLPLILKATVKERTWVRVTIDDEKPKEFTLTPESRPEWKALKGFELLIGNAGGVDLELNGKRLGRLGKPGQVVKLRLPLAEERSASE